MTRSKLTISIEKMLQEWRQAGLREMGREDLVNEDDGLFSKLDPDEMEILITFLKKKMKAFFHKDNPQLNKLSEQIPSIIRRTYRFKSWKHWDDELHEAVMEFYSTFSIFPEILFANTRTLAWIDMAANRAKVEGPDGQTTKPSQSVKITEFNGPGYCISFCLKDDLKDREFILIWDSDPDGGEPLPVEDTSPEKTSQRKKTAQL